MNAILQILKLYGFAFTVTISANADCPFEIKQQKEIRTVSMVIPYRIKQWKHLLNLRLTHFNITNLFEAIVSSNLASIGPLVDRQPVPTLQSYLIPGHLYMSLRYSLGDMSS